MCARSSLHDHNPDPACLLDRHRRSSAFIGGFKRRGPRAAASCWFAVGSLIIAAAGRAGELDELYRARDARSRRVSSADGNWRDGNGDARTLPVGETRVIADVAGPGIIRHIWFTFYGHDPKQGRSLVLRMYWDGAETPAVESPVGDFFAVGHGALREVDSLPVSVTSHGRALNCFWPMPFRNHARITITNESAWHAGVFWYVDYEELPDLPAETPYFHARYRQEYPAKSGEDYLILDAEGEGHYIGTVLSVRHRTTGWFGEGDDRFYIDGETEPSLRGTGTEDYFGDAWGFRQFCRPFNGVTLWDGMDIADRMTAYRWHVNDPVHFQESLKVTIEHRGVMADQDGAWFTNFHDRPDLISSVAFWYQTGRAKRFAELPPAAQRTVPYTHVELDDPERATAEPAGVGLTVQRGSFMGGRQLLATFKQGEGARLAYQFKLDEPITGRARLHMTRAWEYGIWRVKLDGRELPGIDRADLYEPYKPMQEPLELRLGHVELTAGDHQLQFDCLGRNPASKGYFLAIDALTIEQVEPFFVTRENDDAE